VSGLREQLLKLGAHVVVSVRRIVLHLPTATPQLHAWQAIALALGASVVNPPRIAAPVPPNRRASRGVEGGAVGVSGAHTVLRRTAHPVSAGPRALTPFHRHPCPTPIDSFPPR
jgi:hypothetical protein